MPGERENDPNLESELRQTAGREWAMDAAEDESLTELMRRRRLGLGAQQIGSGRRKIIGNDDAHDYRP